MSGTQAAQRRGRTWAASLSPRLLLTVGPALLLSGSFALQEAKASFGEVNQIATRGYGTLSQQIERWQLNCQDESGQKASALADLIDQRYDAASKASDPNIAKNSVEIYGWDFSAFDKQLSVDRQNPGVKAERERWYKQFYLKEAPAEALQRDAKELKAIESSKQKWSCLEFRLVERWRRLKWGGRGLLAAGVLAMAVGLLQTSAGRRLLGNAS